jgi:energy-coupling factor transport system permease protein
LVFSGKDSEIIFQLSFIKIRDGALYLAMFYSLRLLIFISVAFLITLTNSPSELGEALYKLLKPLKKFKIPIDDLTLILFIAIRYIPILYDEFNNIKNAQVIRGTDFSGSIVNKIKKTTSIIIPVFVSAIQRADDLAMALQVRGYKSGNGRTFYSRSGFRLNEWFFTIGTSVYILTLFYFLK